MSIKTDDFDLDEILREYSSPSETASGSLPKNTSAPEEKPIIQSKSEPKREAVQRHEPEHKRREPEPKREPAPKREAVLESQAAKPTRRSKPVPPTLAVLFSAASVLLLVWLMLSVHPDSSASSAAQSGNTDLVAKLNTAVYNSASDALSDVAYIRKIYTIPENDLMAPLPDKTAYGATDDPAEIQAIVDDAWELIDGQELCWNPDIQRWEGSDIKYYSDDSILAIAWKEVINNAMCTFTEIKVADGSQLRRAISENSYGSSVYHTASELASSVNAVAAINGDFYTYRRLGITVYQRQLYRCQPNNVDSCFFTSSGNMLFSHRGELAGEGEAEQFVADNDVLFAVAFGPILVENGQLQTITSYAIGETDTQYSRSVIAQVDKLHYLLMTVNIEGGYGAVATIQQAAQYIYDKGVQSAYALDGGQTSVIIMDGAPVNRVDWGNERTMSDIIYFATAIPGEEQ